MKPDLSERILSLFNGASTLSLAEIQVGLSDVDAEIVRAAVDMLVTSKHLARVGARLRRVQ